MNNNQFFALSILALSVLAGSARADEVPATNDPNPYQTQTLFRLNDGTFESISPIVSEFKNKCDGKGENCKVVIPNKVFMYDRINPLKPVSKMGANYAFMEDGMMITLAVDGSIYAKGFPGRFKFPIKPNLLGGNYFIKEGSDQIVTIDSYGYYNDTLRSAGKIKILGGNYFISPEGILTTIKSAGSAPGNAFGQISTYTPPQGLKPEEERNWIFKDVAQVGGQFFVRENGTVVTISSISGFFYGPYTVPSRPARLGGNYYIGQDNVLYTMNNDGALAPHGQIKKPIAVLGYSFIVYTDGTFTIIAGDGSTHEEIVQVSTTRIQKDVIHSLNLNNINPNSIYLPRVNQQ